MPPKSIKIALTDMLDDLSQEDFENFCHQLLDRREEPRVPRNRVEGKRRFEITDVLVSSFTESGALRVAVEVLTQIDCNEAAKKLATKTTGGH